MDQIYGMGRYHSDSGVARGRAAHPGSHHFGVTPFYNVFVMKTFCFKLLGLNLHTQRKFTEVSAVSDTFFWSLSTSLTEG